MIEDTKKKICELVDRLSKAETNEECGRLLEEIDKNVWIVYHRRAIELLHMEF